MPQKKSATKVAVLFTHPIQYQIPWLQGLARSNQIELKAYYGLIPDENQQAGAFGVPFLWDIPLLEGYPWESLPSARKCPALSPFFGNSTPRIFERLFEAKPDVLILTGWNAFPLVQGWLAALRLGIPMLMRCESNAMRKRPWWMRSIHRAYLKPIRGFLAIGESNRRFYEQYGINPSRIWGAPYFVDNSRLRASHDHDRTERAALRRRWDVPPDAFCFLYVGKLEPKKHILDLLDAMKRAMGRVSRPVHLLVVGAGELMDAARTFATEQMLSVTFAGFLNQTQLTKAYAAGDCLVLPSDFGETWGLVVNEAMVCGLPALVSDRVGCGPDLIRDGETGWTFPFGDTEALALKLIDICADPRRAAEMGANGRDLIKDYSVDAAVKGTLEGIAFIAR